MKLTQNTTSGAAPNIRRYAQQAKADKAAGADVGAADTLAESGEAPAGPNGDKAQLSARGAEVGGALAAGRQEIGMAESRRIAALKAAVAGGDYRVDPFALADRILDDAGR